MAVVSTHQVTLQLCNACLREYEAGTAVVLMRRSHRWSFWCEHSIPGDWYPGSSEPLGMRIGLL